MARDCKGICDNNLMFTKKRLPPDKGSYCSKCEKSYKNPIHWLHGAIIELLPNPWDLITRYYDKDGKRKNVRIFRHIKYLVRQEYCKCCGTKFRAGPLSKTDERKAKRKVRVTIGKVGNKIKPLTKKVERRKPSLPYRLQVLKDYPSLRGRPKKVMRRRLNKDEGKESNTDN